MQVKYAQESTFSCSCDTINIEYGFFSKIYFHLHILLCFIRKGKVRADKDVK